MPQKHDAQPFPFSFSFHRFSFFLPRLDPPPTPHIPPIIGNISNEFTINEKAREILLNLQRTTEAAAQVASDQQYAMGINTPTVVGGAPSAAPSPQPSAPMYSGGGIAYGQVPPLRSASTSSVSSDYGAPAVSAPTATIVSSSSPAPAYGHQAVQPLPPSYNQSSASVVRSGPMESAYGSSSVSPPAYGGGGAPPPAYGGGSNVRVGAGWGGINSAPVSNAPAYQAYGSNGSDGGTSAAFSQGRGEGDSHQFASELNQLAGMGFTDRGRNTALLQKHNGNLQAVVAEMI